MANTRKTFSNSSRNEMKASNDFFKFSAAIALRSHPFSIYAKFSEKLTFLIPLIQTRTCAYRVVRNVSFSEDFAYLPDG